MDPRARRKAQTIIMLWRSFLKLCSIHLMSFLLLATTASESAVLDGHFYMPGLNLKPYMKEGDIKVGAIITMTESSKTANACSRNYPSSSYYLQTTEAVAYAVKSVNDNPDLLPPNTTLGFVMLDACSKMRTSLASSLAFLPLVARSCGTGPACKSKVIPSTSYDVIGAVGPGGSVATVPVSSLYAVARLPLVGYTATSDTLSDKSQHPYYFRVVPPDRHQVQAMLQFIFDNNWSYISVVYSQGAYGEKAYDNFKQMSPLYNVCIASHHRLTSNVEFDEVASELVRYSRARVVVTIIGSSSVRSLFQSVKELNYTNHFIWIGSDAWAFGFENFFSDFKEVVLGAFSFTYYCNNDLGLYEHIETLSVNTSTNPVLKSNWEYLADCSFAEGTCDPNENILLSERNSFYASTSLVIDSVMAIAQAAHNLLKNVCPTAQGSEARACITGELLKEYMVNTSFDGATGHIEFDQNYDVKGRYLIRQIVNDYQDNVYFRKVNHTPAEGLVAREIGIYDIISGNITYGGANISWSHLDTLERIVPIPYGSIDDGTPESVCSRPCLNGEYKIEKELPCCWECRRCRDNERVVSDNTSCEACPTFTWPDPGQNYTVCSPIPLTYPSLTDSLPVLLLCMSLGAAFFTVLILITYVKYRNERVIKAASRELSFLQLAAIFLGYVTVIIFQLKPSDATCKIVFAFFCLSFAWLYCPLLVKTVRIFRIFHNSAKNNRRPRFVSPQSQLVMSGVLIGAQVLICIIIFSAFNPSSKLHQPVWSEKLVELTCDLTVPGLVSFLAYNLVLVTCCSVFAFKTRKLPDNFNESRFISMCVSTTLVIWLAFIPTYFTAGRVFVQALLLSAALLLNHTVALLFLFVPKIYAAIYLPAEQQTNFVTTRFQTQTTPATWQQRSVASSTNRIAPSSDGVQPQDGFTC